MDTDNTFYLDVQNVFTFVKNGNLPLQIMKIFNFMLRNDQYLASRIPNAPISKKSIYFPAWKCFLTGALPLVLEKYPCKFVDNRITPHNFDKSKISIPEWLRKHQRDALKLMLNYERGVVHHTTAAGKTYLTAAWVDAVPVNHMIVVHRKEILFQFIERFKETLHEDFDLAWSSETSINHNRVLIGMIQSIVPRIVSGEIDPLMYQSIIVDEGHHAGWGSQYLDLLLKAANAFFRFALTGTPIRESGDDIVMTGLFGPTIHTYKYTDALEDGYVVPVHVMIIDKRLTIPRYVPVEPYHEFYKCMIVENMQRNSLISDISALSVKTNRSTLVLVEHINHGNILLDMIKASIVNRGFSQDKANIIVDFVHGKDPHRLQKRKDFEEGSIKCLIGTTLYDEGIDIHSISTIILAAGGRSERALLQRIGRGQRIESSKNNLIVFDFTDSFTDKTGSHFKKRLKVFKKEGYKIQGFNA